MTDAEREYQEWLKREQKATAEKAHEALMEFFEKIQELGYEVDVKHDDEDT